MDDTKVPPETIPTAELLSALRWAANEYQWCTDLELQLEKSLSITLVGVVACYCTSCSTAEERSNRLTPAADAPAEVTRDAIIAAFREVRQGYLGRSDEHALKDLALSRWGIELTAGVA